MFRLYSSAAHRFDDYASANWPRLWRLRPHLLLIVVGSNAAFSLAAVWLSPPDIKSAGSAYTLGMMALILGFTAALCYWVYATGRTLHIRALPGLRYSPRLSVVGVLVLFNLGLFAFIAGHIFGAARLATKLDGSGEVSIYVGFPAFFAQLCGLLLFFKWFPSRALPALVVLALITYLIGRPLDSQVGVLILAPLSLFVVVAYAGFALLSLARGVRSQWAPVAAAVAVAFGPFIGPLNILVLDVMGYNFGIDRVWPGSSVRDHKFVFMFVEVIVLFELLCWLSAKQELLPEHSRRPRNASVSHGSSVAAVRESARVLSFGLRRLTDDLSRSWPGLWRGRPNLLLLAVCLSAAFGLALAQLHRFLSAPLPEVALVGALSILGAILLFWLHAAGRAPPIRAVPVLRYRPRFALVATAAALLLVQTIWLSGIYDIIADVPRIGAAYLLVYAALLVFMTSRWFSFRSTLLSLIGLVAAAVSAVVLTSIPWPLPPRVSTLALIFGPAFILPLLLVLALVRGIRARWVPGAIVSAIYLAHVPLLLFAVALAVETRPKEWSTAPVFVIFFAASALLVEFVCWVGARLELLPERR